MEESTDHKTKTKIEEAQNLKTQGNQHFTNKDYVKALRCYHQAHLYIAGMIDKKSPMVAYSKQIIDQHTHQSIQQLKFCLFMNMAQIYVFQRKFLKGLQILTKASEIKTNTKLKYRKAVCLIELQELDKARNLLHQVLAEMPDMAPQVNQHLSKIKVAEKKLGEKEKKMYKKIFET